MRELFEVLSPAPASIGHGAYYGFLSDLDQSGFSARDNVLLGLSWAKEHISSKNDLRPSARIAKRIAIESLDALDQFEVADSLADLILTAQSTLRVAVAPASRSCFRSQRGERS